MLRQRRLSDFATLGLLIAVVLMLLAPMAGAADGPSRDLQLEVTINGQKTNLIAAFKQTHGRGLYAARSELEELSLRAPGGGKPDDLVRLEDLDGLSYKIDDKAQTIDITASDRQRLRRVYDAYAGPPRPQPARADYGAVVNYSLFAAAGQQTRDWRHFNDWSSPAFNGANVSLDTRLIMPHGVLNSGFLVGANVAGETETLRLDTYAIRVDPDTLKTYRIGDVITGGLTWTRPLRMGGAQIQHNYRFRPDLVTGALPSFSGSAAVPSTVDVYVNNVRTFSQNVGDGPFQINNLPLTTGNGEARVVIRDASGREEVKTLPFSPTGQLLKVGVYESSIEVGVPRLRYGIASDDYEEKLVAAATLRRGMTEDVTLETHAETGLGVVNGGVGVVVRAGRLGIVNFAVSGSDNQERSGVQGYAALDTRVGAVSIRASTLRATKQYDDIARVTAKLRPSLLATNTGLLFSTGFELKPARTVDTLSLSAPLGFDPSTVNASLLRVESDDGEVSRLMILSYARPLIAGANFFATAFYNIDDAKSRGVYAGIHIPLGDTPLGQNAHASTSVASTAKGTTYTADVGRSLGSNVGDWGWRVRDTEGQQSSRDASLAHRSSVATINAGVRQDGSTLTGRATVDGAVVAMGGNVFFANRIHDGFAVVDTGAPGITVKHQNNIVGETNASGKILVPSLQAYQGNKISIDPQNLPIDAEVDKTSIRATPAHRSGVYVDFQVKTSVAAALVILHGNDGKAIAAGAEVLLNGDPTVKVLGYDGQVYLNDLKPTNSVTVSAAKGQICTAKFNYTSQPGTQSVIGPIVCH